VHRPTRVDHLCWVYDDAVGFRDRASAFLTEGIVAGERLEYLGAGSLDDVHRRVRQDPGLAMLLEGGHLALRSLPAIYGENHCVEGVEAVAAYAAATEEALAGGYAGLRVVAEATELVRTPAQRDAFARYEHLIDRYMVDHPFAAMCGYDSRELGPTAAAEIACLHPAVSRNATSFRWFSTAPNEVCLSGEVDVTSQEVFDRTLSRTMDLQSVDLLVDARALEFISPAGLLALETRAREAGIMVSLQTGSVVVHRLAELLELHAVCPRWSS
jgi:anti-anti-sigma regulatory factor